jgi:Pregnancy-associated plasma protein-A
VLNNDGSGGATTTSDLCMATRNINEIFNKYNIFFKYAGYDDIRNNTLYGFDGSSTLTANLFSTQLQQGAINVYIVPSVPGGGGCVKSIPTFALAVDQSSVINSTSTIAHEIGHCLGLYHTHETFFAVEQINGSNSTIAGDKISDTPADPDLFGRVSSCVYTSTTTQNGILFSPDVRNVMSNSGNTCRDRFSPMQVNAMYNVVLTHPDFAGIRTASIFSSPIPTISGINPVCNNRQFSVNGVNAPFFAAWFSSNDGIASVTNFNQIDRTTVSRVSDGKITLTAKITNLCELYSVSKDVYIGKPGLIQGSFSYGTYTYPVNNPSTGIAVSSSTPNIYINLSPPSDPSSIYSWTSPPNNGTGSYSTNGSNASIYLSGGTYRNLICSANNLCGNSPEITFNCYNYSYYQVIASPNPASQDLFVTTNLIDQGSIGNRTEKLLKTVDLDKTPLKLIDSNNRIIESGKLRNGAYSFKLSNVPDGTYVLQISEGDNLITRQIIIRH